MPGVQKPHCVPSFSWKACCRRLMRPSIGEALDGLDVPAFAGRGERDAGQARLAVDQHRAGAAFAAVAALLGAGEADGRRAGTRAAARFVGDRVLARAAVDRQCQQTFGHGVTLPFGRRSRTRTALPCERGISPGFFTTTSVVMPISDLMWCATSRAMAS